MSAGSFRPAQAEPALAAREGGALRPSAAAIAAEGKEAEARKKEEVARKKEEAARKGEQKARKQAETDRDAKKLALDRAEGLRRTS